MISFLICGAQKSGTSALHQYLINHPEISLSKTKELHIFDNEYRDWTEEGIMNIDGEIDKYFENKESNKKRGEATPSSMWWKPAMKRIWQYNPNMKLIAILRNPITRAYSNWKMEVNKGREFEKLPLSVEQEENRCKSALPYQHRIYSYISRGMYTEQIKRIWQYFPRNNLLLLKQEDLRNQPSKVLQQVYRHIGVKNMKLKEKKDVISWNSQVKHSKEKKITIEVETDMNIEIKTKLREVYRDEITKIEEITGWNCSTWYA